MKKNYGVSVSYSYETVEEAVKFASQRATRNGEDVRVWQAIKLVAPKTPDVTISDITL